VHPDLRPHPASGPRESVRRDGPADRTAERPRDRAARSIDRAEAPPTAPDQTQAPYLAAVRRYVATGGDGRPMRAFHTPGHIGGRGIDAELGAMLGASTAHDLCQMPELGDVYDDPTATSFADASPIGKAQVLAARAVGADRTFFGVNGSSGSNQVMLAAVLRDGETLLLPRHVHKSVVHGMIDVGARPDFLEPEIDETRRVALPPTPEQIARKMTPLTRAVLVVSPTYYGDVADVPAIARVVHARGVPLLVDQAWGAHFPYHSATRSLDATAGGADMCVQSTHKSLGALTQTSVLHVRGRRVAMKNVEAAYKLRGTTSPSIPLLASIDASRREMVVSGEALLTRTMTLVREARAALARIPGIRVVGATVRGPKSGATFRTDPTKLMFTVDGLGISGYDALAYLRDTHALQLEIANHSSVVALCTHGTTAEQVGELVAGVRALALRHPAVAAPVVHRDAAVPALPPVAMPPRAAFYARKAERPLALAAGSVSAETVTSYPPATPLVVPGERFTPELVAHVRALLRARVHVHGVSGATPDAWSVRVVAETAKL